MAKGEGAESVSSAGLLQQTILKQEEFIRPKRESKEKLSICSKVCYAIGGAPYQVTGCALGFFLQIYLLDVAQLDPFYASIILFVGRAWDAVTDPLVGFFISKTRWSRLGRLMPWILFSTPFGVISYILIWYVPDISQGQVMWYLFFYCVFQTLVTCFHVPYSALTMFISREQSERDSATAYRKGHLILREPEADASFQWLLMPLGPSDQEQMCSEQREFLFAPPLLEQEP